MKQIFIIGLLGFLFTACGQITGKDTTGSSDLVNSDAKVQVYYFHGKMRCVTCVALQEVAEEAVRENFEGNKDVQFLEIDFSESANAALAEKYEVIFSSLIIANDTNYKDITDQAFALVMGNPSDLKALIARETNSFLNR